MYLLNGTDVWPTRCSRKVMPPCLTIIVLCFFVLGYTPFAATDLAGRECAGPERKMYQTFIPGEDA